MSIVRERTVRVATPSDPRFSRLVAAADWARLPAPIRRRFSRHLAPAETAVYVGVVASTTVTFAGRLVGQLGRLVGAPLPLAPSGRVAAAVVVTEDAALGGQSWTRLYARPGRPPQIIHSTKRFAGPTGLEECVGGGVGMRLRLTVERRALVFRSAGFFIRLAGRSWALPAWLAPGDIEVVHREERAGEFSFTLTVSHPWLGVIVRQIAFFRERCALPREGCAGAAARRCRGDHLP